MASPDQWGWEFVDPPESEFYCLVCRKILRDPNLTSCCGNHFCQACIEPLICTEKPCPGCGEAAFTAILDKSVRRKIFALDVRCPMWRRGCRWTGKLGTLAVHLDGEKGDCEYVDASKTFKSRSLKDNPEQHSRQMAEIQEILRGKDQQTQKELKKRDKQIAQLWKQKEVLEREIQQLSESFQEKYKQFQASLDQMSQELSKKPKGQVEGTQEQDKQMAQIWEHITQLETTFAEKTRENDMLKRRVGSLEMGGVQRLDPPTVDEVLDDFADFKRYNGDYKKSFSMQQGRTMQISMTPDKIVSVHVHFTDSYRPSDEKTRITVQITDPTGREPPCSKTKYGYSVKWSNFISMAEMEKYARNNMVHFSVCVKEAD